MKFTKLTMGLAAVGVVSLASAARADETKMSQVQTALSNTTLSGYVDVSAMWNPGIGTTSDGRGGNLPPYTPGTTSYGSGGVTTDGFNLNAVDLALDKPMDESPWAAGYHVELMAGPDSVPNASFGTSGLLENGGMTIRQAYLALRTPVGNSAIDWKVGVFDTIIGYESSSDPLNPNFTRSYGYNMEPTTETGILGTYKVNDELSVSAGIANTAQVDNEFGLNQRADIQSQKAYLASVAFTAPDSWGWAKGATINGGIIQADDGEAGTSAEGTTSLYIGATVPTPYTALKVGAAFDYIDLHNGGTGLGGSDDSAWNIGLYASWQINDKASLNLRAEHQNDNGAGLAHGAAGGDRNVNADEFTATLQYNLWANVLSRVEFRYDHVEHGKAFGLVNNGFGETSVAHDQAYLLALNLIYQF